MEELCTTANSTTCLNCEAPLLSYGDNMSNRILGKTLGNSPLGKMEPFGVDQFTLPFLLLLIFGTSINQVSIYNR